MWDKSKKCLLHKHLFIFYLHNSLLAFKAWTLQQLFQQSGAIIPNEKLKNGSLTMTAKLVLPKPEPLPLAKKSQISEQHLQVWLMADNWLELWLNWVTPYKLINNLCFRTYCAILSIFALAPCILEAPLLPMMGWRLRLSAAAQRMCFPLLRTSHTATALPLLYSHTHIFLPWKQQLSLCYSFTSSPTWFLGLLFTWNKWPNFDWPCCTCNSCNIVCVLASKRKHFWPRSEESLIRGWRSITCINYWLHAACDLWVTFPTVQDKNKHDLYSRRISL